MESATEGPGLGSAHMWVTRSIPRGREASLPGLSHPEQTVIRGKCDSLPHHIHDPCLLPLASVGIPGHAEATPVAISSNPVVYNTARVAQREDTPKGAGVNYLTFPTEHSNTLRTFGGNGGTGA